jgi:tetratricopeptide (TPR) repeat protein
MKKYIIILLLAIATTLSAQTSAELQGAFTSSYVNEEAKEYDAAIKDLQKIYDALSYEINVRIGWLNYYAGDYPNSLRYYKIAMELMPYSIEAKFGYALPLSAQGNWNEVMGIFKEVLKTDPQNAYANYKVGAIYYERGEYETAIKHTEKVVNMYPFDYDAVILLAWINLKMEDYRKAKILFNKSLLILPGNTSALEGLELIQ